MEDGAISISPKSASTSSRWRFAPLIPLFLGAVAIGFTIHFSVYKNLLPSNFRLNVMPSGLHPQPERRRATWIPKRLRSSSSSSSSEPSVPVPNLQFPSTPDTDEDTQVTPRPPKAPSFWELPTLIDLPNFRWLMNNPSICKVDKSEKNYRLLPILVHTERNHFLERQAIRKSFGSLVLYKNWVIRLVFLLGDLSRGQAHENRFLQQKASLEVEQSKYGDLVAGNFIDTYHNLTYKHLMGYKWILNFCQGAEFVLKIDDDMFVDILRWLDWRTADLDNKTSGKAIPDLYCIVFGGTKPIRDKGSKWYTSTTDWPQEYYPDYCSGWAYGITVDLIRILYEATKNVKFFWVDDVYATGALVEYVKKEREKGINPRVKGIGGDVTGNINDYQGFCEKGRMEEERKFKAVVYVPRGSLLERDMMCMWNKTKFDNKLSPVVAKDLRL